MVGTDILAATVVGEALTDLDEDMNVTVIFQPKIPDGKVATLMFPLILITACDLVHYLRISGLPNEYFFR